MTTRTTTRDGAAAVRRCFECALLGDWEAVAETLDPDFVLHPQGARGVEGLREVVEGYQRAIEGLDLTVDEQFGDGDRIATRWTVRGRHRGEAFGVPPTGRPVEFGGITVSHCRDGRILEEWEVGDIPGLLAQIGGGG
jgi:predicted ester cyclase